jgi:hypothetical protein
MRITRDDWVITIIPAIFYVSVWFLESGQARSWRKGHARLWKKPKKMAANHFLPSVDRPMTSMVITLLRQR